MKKYIIFFFIFLALNLFFGLQVIDNPKNILGYFILCSSFFQAVIFLAILFLYKEKITSMISLQEKINLQKAQYEDLDESFEFLDRENQKLKTEKLDLNVRLLGREKKLEEFFVKEGEELDNEIKGYLPHLPENIGALK